MAKKSKKKPDANVDVVDAINEALGVNAIRRLGDTPQEDIETISTGSIGLDIALGCGGLPRGRIVEIYGPESSGKTTLCLHVIAEAQKLGLSCAFVDAEHAIDVRYAAALGVDTDALLLTQPDSGEQALQITELLCKSEKIGVVVVDSVAALTPQKELDGDIGDSHVGLQARMMGQAMRKIGGIAHSTGTLIIFINQIRMKIGVMFGSPETTPGGNALKFYSSVRLDIRRIGKIMDGETRSGNRTRVKVVKNKVSPPFRQAEFDIVYGTGINRSSELIEHGVTCGAIDKAGAWLSFCGERIGQGRLNAAKYLDENPHIAEQVKAAIECA